MAPQYRRRRDILQDGWLPRTRRFAPSGSETEQGVSLEVPFFQAHRAPKTKKDVQKMKSILKTGVTGYGLPDGCVATIVYPLTPVENVMLSAMGDVLMPGVDGEVENVDSKADDCMLGAGLLMPGVDGEVENVDSEADDCMLGACLLLLMLTD